MAPQWTRRDALVLSAGALLGLNSASLRSQDTRPAGGRVEGWPEAASAGQRVLAEGGNAVDAVVTAALVAGVVAPQMCGPGGYGGHAVVATPEGKTAAIDFNGTAPATFREDIFPLDDAGDVIGRVNESGWLAAGVPGTLAGLQLLLDRFGTRPFDRAVELAIRFARDGFTVGGSLAGAAKGSAAALRRDSASAALLLPGGEPPKPGATLRNPDLAGMLETLATQGSVEPFYRGKVAAGIAAAFKAGGGLVTDQDLAAYRAREVSPLTLEWNGVSIHTPPPTAGGLTALQTLAVLKALGWSSRATFEGRRALIETSRVAWRDRLAQLGDPEHGEIPAARLLSAEHAASLAEEVARSLKENRPVAGGTDGRPAGGTIHLSAADAQGMFVALTLTHGGSFGAKVTVPGLGLVLGHGMSRFEPRPGHPNSPGPGKRPQNNMCPTVVLRDGRPTVALGGRGGRKIVNAMVHALAEIAAGRSPDEALAAPRLHTEGGLTLELEKSWPEQDVAPLSTMGYEVRRASHATLSAVWKDVSAGELRAVSR